jgi:hypothetical protein
MFPFRSLMLSPENAKQTAASVHIEGDKDDESNGQSDKGDGQLVIW